MYVWLTLICANPAADDDDDDDDDDGDYGGDTSLDDSTTYTKQI
jgi:hypothetical protein